MGRTIEEWLALFPASFEQDKLSLYISLIRNCHRVVSALYELFQFDNVTNESLAPIITPVCSLLFNFYRSMNSDLRRFALQFVPTLTLTYLWNVHDPASKMPSEFEAYLLGVYNLEVVEADGNAKTTSFTIPSLATSSVFHEPLSIASLALTESSLLRYHSDMPVVISTVAHPQYEGINAHNRMTILTTVLKAYIADIVNLPASSHAALCLLGARACQRGFENLNLPPAFLNVDLHGSLSSLSSVTRGPAPGPGYTPSPSVVALAPAPAPGGRAAPAVGRATRVARIALSQPFLLQILHGIYFVIFNGFPVEGVDALESIHLRSSFELFTNVLLVSNAIQQSIEANPSACPVEGPVATERAPTGTSRLSKQAITNASFRTRKLPDDIPLMTSSQLPTILDHPTPRAAAPPSGPLAKSTELRISRRKRHIPVGTTQDDIDVLTPAAVDGGADARPRGSPPGYHDVIDGDKRAAAMTTTTSSPAVSPTHTPSTRAKNHPIKSIMKKGEKSHPVSTPSPLEPATIRPRSAADGVDGAATRPRSAADAVDASMVSVEMVPMARQSSNLDASSDFDEDADKSTALPNVKVMLNGRRDTFVSNSETLDSHL